MWRSNCQDALAGVYGNSSKSKLQGWQEGSIGHHNAAGDGLAHPRPSLASGALNRKCHALGSHDPASMVCLGLAGSRLGSLGLVMLSIVRQMASLAGGE
jgi:hypothetical protein